MIEDVEVVVVSQCRVNGNVNHTGKGGAHIDKTPFRTVTAYIDDFCTLFVSERQKAPGHGIGIAYEFFCAYIVPFTFDTASKHVSSVGKDFLDVFDKVE